MGGCLRVTVAFSMHVIRRRAGELDDQPLPLALVYFTFHGWVGILLYTAVASRPVEDTQHLPPPSP